MGGRGANTEFNEPIVLDPGETKRKRSGVSVFPKVGCTHRQITRSADLSGSVSDRNWKSGDGPQRSVFYQPSGDSDPCRSLRTSAVGVCHLWDLGSHPGYHGVAKIDMFLSPLSEHKTGHT